jgi:glyoxylase-like metal-dependent hydrolase (beta-lactamase superfamily II)
MSKHAFFQSFETSRGARIYAIPVEAFPNFYAYAYLVQTKDLLVLIDTGSGGERSHETLQAGMKEAGTSLGRSIDFTDLTHIIITHGHIDHFGGLVRLRELTKARIGIHELDYQTVAHHEERLAVMGRRLDVFLRQWGVEDETRTFLLQMYRFDKAFYKSVKVDFTLDDSNLSLGPFEMIHVPGHCPGHICIRLDDIIFCGDLVVEGVTPHQSPEELTPFLGVNHYLESLTRFKRWAGDAKIVLSGHDAPISNVQMRISEIRENLARRLHQTLEGFSQPNTVANVCKFVYGDIGGYNSLLVQEKMGAYVEYLYHRGFLEISNLSELESGDEFPVIRYRCSKSVSMTELLPKERADVFI